MELIITSEGLGPAAELVDAAGAGAAIVTPKTGSAGEGAARAATANVRTDRIASILTNFTAVC